MIRDLQNAFKPSKLFAPWLEAEKASREKVNVYQRRRRRDKRLNVKIGHGGTLDPLATGVLIIGVGKGTKQLESFLSCTKSYDTVLLFGAATDTYDVLGKVLNRASYSQVTRDGVEKALDGFRGRILQRPPIFSAISVQGKRLYEYAREGKEVPVEIQERPVNVENLEIIDWLEPGSHGYRLPNQEAETIEKETAERILHLNDVGTKSETIISNPEAEETHTSTHVDGARRKRSIIDEPDDLISTVGPASKRRETDQKFQMSGGLQYPEREGEECLKTSSNTTDGPPTQTIEPSKLPHAPPSPDKGPPAIKLRMTVTSGFYVRSLCHDLGKAVGSLGVMAELVRTRQGDFELGKNVFGHNQLTKGEDVWGPQVENMLRNWEEKAHGNKELPTEEVL